VISEMENTIEYHRLNEKINKNITLILNHMRPCWYMYFESVKIHSYLSFNLKIHIQITHVFLKIDSKVLIILNEINWYSETCLHWTLNKPKSCINQTLNKVQMKEIFVNLAYINRTHLFRTIKSWSHRGSV